MADSDRWWLLVPRGVRTLPADLAAVIGLTVLTGVAVLTPGLRETPLRIVLGLPFVLFLPGYALVAALFPEAGDPPSETTVGETESDRADGSSAAEPASNTGATAGRARSGIDGIERVALSFGLSIAVVPLVGLVLNFTPFGIRLVPILVSVSLVTVSLSVIGAYRRRQLPVEDRLTVPYREWVARGKAELFSPESRMDGALNVLLVVSVVLAASSVAYAVAVPKQGESFTEFYLLTEQENGSLVADDYPTEFTVGEGQPVVVGVGNHEHHEENYTVVVELQEVRIQNNSTRVLGEQELQRFNTRVAAGEDWREQVSVVPSMTGERLRLVFLLYKESVPAAPQIGNAYREVHLWVNVSTPEPQSNG